MSLGRAVLGYHGRLRVAESIPVACGDPAVAPFFFFWSYCLFWPYSRPVRLVPRAPLVRFPLFARRSPIVPYRLRRGRADVLMFIFSVGVYTCRCKAFQFVCVNLLLC